MLIALYRAQHGYAVDSLIDAFSGGDGYSHAECVFDRLNLPDPFINPTSFSSTSRDVGLVDEEGTPKEDGTRYKSIDYNLHPERWDIFRLPHSLEDEYVSFRWTRRTLNCRYDYAGCGRFIPVLGWFCPVRDKEYFCSEVCVETAQVGNREFLIGTVPHKTSPNVLSRLLRRSGCERVALPM